jgi:diaminopimelate epimerase
MKLKFTKMHGAGNDFIVIDAINQQIELAPAQWKPLADRRFGIGADQILIVEAPTEAGCDFRYRIFNNDGGEVEQCGNGSRAFVTLRQRQGLTDKRSIRVQTMAGIITPRLEDDGSVTVDMGAPVLEPERVPFDSKGLEGEPQGRDTCGRSRCANWAAREKTVLVSVVSMGNPHAVQVVDDVDTAPVELKPARRSNTTRASRTASTPATCRCWTAITSNCACSSAAPAKPWPAAPAPARPWWPASAAACWTAPVQVEARGGRLSIAWDGEGQPVWLTGPAETVFEGKSR